MERKGECCLAPRYGQAGGQAWQMGRIMLKFRPIAPKPAAMAPSAPVPSPVTAAGTAKGKRKAVPGGSGRRGRKAKKAATVAAVTAAPAALKMGDQEREKVKSVSPTSSSSGMTSVDSSPPPPPPATLPLLPVLSTEKELVAPAPDLGLSHGAGQIVAPQALRPAAVTWVTVEAVTGTWCDGEAPSAAACGSVGDEAPSFVSDQWGRVSWTNSAFDRAASAGAATDEDNDASAPESPRVVLAAKGAATVPAWGTCAGFACRVCVRHACPRRGPLVTPCDVWRLDAGGYLWRLDLQATLSLSLGGGLL